METRSQHSTTSPRGALERHFQSQRGGGGLLREQASNWTLPRSYKAPESHSNTPPAPAPGLRARSSLAEAVNAAEMEDAVEVQDGAGTQARKGLGEEEEEEEQRPTQNTGSKPQPEAG